ncbi:hypothetical protein MMC25_001972 [Agyrium rufum]|nr:hypothetical protein [Agyrium rufum]
MSQQDVQGRNISEPLNSASEVKETDAAEAQEAANRGAGYIRPDKSTLESSNHEDSSITTAANSVQESQTSADEPAHDIHTQPNASNKRRHRASGKASSKTPRKIAGRSGRRGS